ncbi:hypothetical protein NPX13_g8549 [Xylaria arbuscula]|uniref:Uncharacterized protein n=1 Tax=Xylaria arbuscula TaxID=114810 RepID=A0A9W8N7Z3_9PEZI|nr:hypothetical protein NPX13_g8549 [Xylaria arbuscula]
MGPVGIPDELPIFVFQENARGPILSVKIQVLATGVQAPVAIYAGEAGSYSSLNSCATAVVSRVTGVATGGVHDGTRSSTTWSDLLRLRAASPWLVPPVICLYSARENMGEEVAWVKQEKEDMGFPRFFGAPKPERIPSQDVNDEPVEVSKPPSYQSAPSIDQPNSLKLTWNVDEQPSTEYKSDTASFNACLNDNNYSDGYHTVPKLWNSVWLRTKLLISFVVLFVVLFVVTIILYVVSEKNHGLSAEDATRQYGWRYGPTAFLAVVLSLWTQIDYSSKILTPWQEMRRGPTDASRSVLVDYISPPMVIVWWRALKSRHWAVTASISGILLIQLATVFSTGLFVLQPTTLSMDDVPITVKSSFNGSDFRLTNSSTTVETGPSLLYYGSQVNGLATPPGVDISRGLVVPDLTPSDKFNAVNGTNYTAIVPGAEASLECEYLPGLNGTKTSLPWWSILGAFFVLNIETPTCNISNIIVGEGPDHNIYHQPDATQAYMAYFGDYLCDPSIDYSYYENLPDPSNTTVEHRIVMTVADLRFSPYDPYSAGPAYIYMENLTVAVCKSGYAMGDYEVTYKDGIDGQSKSWMANEISTSEEEEIPGFSSEQLGAAVQSSLDQTYLGTGGQDWVLTKQVPTFYQILSAMNGNVSIGHFMDYDKLISSATDAFKGISAELISNQMMKLSKSSVSGSILYQEDRLWVRALSVGFMAGAFLLLAGLTAVLLIFRPRNVVPSDPGSIGATALILAESSALRSLLSGLGAARTREVKQKLSSYHFRSVIAPGPQKTFTVVPTEHGQPTDSKGTRDDSPAQSEHWWVPSAARLWFQLLAITLPLIIIAVLEVIQRLSDKNNGFVDLGSGGFATTHGFATYIPAVVAFIVATMFTSMQLAVCILSPWLALHRGSAPASRSLFLNLINRLAPHRIFLAFKNGNMGEVLIMIATFLAAWLPILVSGLYVTVPATSSHTVSLAQSDLFDFKLNNLFYDDNLAGTIAGLIAYKGLAYPKWTYDDLAFNTLDATGLPTDTSADEEVPFVAKMQATRPSLTCEVVSPDLMKARWDSQASQSLLVTDDAVALNLTSQVPWMCETPRGNTTSLSWFQGFALPADGSPIYFGHASVLTLMKISTVG